MKIKLFERTKIEPEWIFLGLGNIGDKYYGTRHNFGFRAVEYIAGADYPDDWKKRSSYFFHPISSDILCALPGTYMNRSGIAAVQLLKKYEIPLDRLLVFYDDLDINPGRIRIRKRGSAGGHKGIESIIAHTGGSGFPRIRLGIGGRNVEDIVEYVLSDFDSNELALVDKVIEDAASAALSIAQGRIEEAMNKYN